MANPTCTRDSLISGAACYREPVISKHDQDARLVYLKVLELQAIGGTDYRSAVNTLFVDANTLSCGFQPGDFDGAAVVIAANNATAAGASVPSTRATLADAVKCFENFTDFQLKQAKLLLDCKLGVSKAYPQ